MILCTPNAASFYHKLPDRFALNFDEAHLYVFSPVALSHIAKRIGWVVETVRTHEYTSDSLRLVSRIVRLMKDENPGITGRQYSKKANNPITDKIIWTISRLTAPLRWYKGLLA